MHLVVFRRFRDLMATIFGTKRDISYRQSDKDVGTIRGSSLHRLETSWTLSHKRLKMGPSFLPILHSTSLPLHKEVSKQNSTKLRDMLGNEPDLQMSVKIDGFISHLYPHPKNCGLKTAYFVTVLISTKLCQMTKNRARVFTPSVNARHDHCASRIRWRRIANVSGIIEIKSLASRGPQNFQFAMASRRAALSGNTFLTAILSSFFLLSIVSSFSFRHAATLGA